MQEGCSPCFIDLLWTADDIPLRLNRKQIYTYVQVPRQKFPVQPFLITVFQMGWDYNSQTSHQTIGSIGQADLEK